MDNELIIPVPFVLPFGDYHEIEEKLDFLKQFDRKLKAFEVGFDGRYWGIYYYRKPNKTTIKELLKDYGFHGELYEEK